MVLVVMKDVSKKWRKLLKKSKIKNQKSKSKIKIKKRIYCMKTKCFKVLTTTKTNTLPFNLVETIPDQIPDQIVQYLLHLTLVLGQIQHHVHSVIVYLYYQLCVSM